MLMREKDDLDKLMQLYPLLIKHKNIRVSKGRCIVYDHRTGEADLESLQNFVLLSLFDGTRKLSETAKLYQDIFSCPSAESWRQVERLLARHADAIVFHNEEQTKRTYFHLSLLKNIDRWPYSPLRDEYPHKLTIVLTECCNHQCDYCFKSCDSSRGQELSVREWLRVIDQAQQMGVQEITFTGGEPFLYKNFLTLVTYCSEKGIYTKISTNGTLLDKDTVRRLKQSGAEFIHLSLPCVSEELYDRITKSRWDFRKVVQAIHQLKQHGFYLRAKMVLTPNNTQEAEKLIDFCAANGVDFLHLAPYILTENSRLGRQLIPAETALMKIRELADEKRKIHKNMVISEVPIASLKWADHTCISKCGGIKDSLTILANGDITFCEALGDLPEFILGNISDTTLEQLWNSPKPDKITSLDGKRLDPSCLTCKYLQQCQTGCFAFSHMQTNNPWSMDPRCFYFCGAQNIFDNQN